jgi:hypothetical protein
MSAAGQGKVLLRLKRFRSALKWVLVQRAWGYWLGLLPLHLLVLAVLEHTGDHSTESRARLLALLWWGVGLWLAGLLVPIVWHFLVKHNLPDDEALASRLGWGSSEIRDRLLNALQLQKSSLHNREGYDPELMLASLDRILPALDAVQDRQSLPIPDRNRGIRLGSAVALLWLVIGAAGGGDSLLALRRILDPQADFRPPAAFALHLSSDRTRIVQGEAVTLEVIPRGRTLPDHIDLYSRTEAGTDLVRPLELVRGKARLENLVPGETSRFWAKAGEVVSDTLTLDVLLPPVLRELRVAISPPAYTNLPREELPEGLGEVRCPVGSRIEVYGRLNQRPVTGILLVEQGGGRQLIDLHERFGAGGDSLAFQGSFVARAEGQYSLQFTNRDSLSLRGESVHALGVVPDQPPVLRVLKPVEAESRLDRDLVQNLLAVAEDDYGIGSLRLVYRIRSGLLGPDPNLPDPASLAAPPEDWTVVPLPVISREPRRAGLEHAWDLSSAGLLPDDRVHFYLEAFDNDGWNGPKSTRSALYTLKVPGMEELYAEVEQDQGDLASEAEEILEETRENSRRLQELSQELRKNPETTWEQQQKLKQLAERQQELMQQAAKTSEKLEQLQEKLDLNNLVSEELKQKFQRLNELLKEAIDPELMQKLQQAAQKAQAPPQEQPPRAQEKSMADMQEMLNEMERQMEQFLSVLEEMRLQQKLEEFGRRLMEMADRQQQVGEDLNQRKPGELARDEQALKKDFEQLRDEVDQLGREFAQNPNLPKEQLDQFQQQIAEQQPQQGMEQLSKDLEQARTGDSSKEQSDQVEMQLESLAAQMQQAAQQASNNAKQELAREIDRVCQELLVLSHQQERVNGENPGLDARSARLPRLAETTLENRLGLAACADAVAVLSRRSFLIPRKALGLLGTGLGGLDRMLTAYEERSLAELQRSGPQVLGSVNQTILVLKEAKSNMQSSQSAGGFEEMMEKLAQASSQQQGLNGQCSKLMSTSPGGSQKPMSISFGDAASQQADLRRQMEGLAEKLGQQGRSGSKGKSQGEGEGETGEGDQGKPGSKPGPRPGEQPGEDGVLGDLGQAAKDMQEVEQDLLNRQYTERTKKLQERILTRLLEAQQSVRRQDFSEKRESRAATPLRAAPPAGMLPETGEGLQQDLLRALREGYTPEYEKLIRDYFRALEGTPEATSTPATEDR